MIMCVLDFGLTFKLHQWGGSEVNWLMADLLEGKPILLSLMKLGLTLICLIFLIFHKNFRVLGLFRTGDAIYIIFAVYLILTSYELYGMLSVRHFLFLP